MVEIVFVYTVFGFSALTYTGGWACCLTPGFVFVVVSLWCCCFGFSFVVRVSLLGVVGWLCFGYVGFRLGVGVILVVLWTPFRVVLWISSY